MGDISLRGRGIVRVGLAKGGKAFPDLTGDGKVTRADVLKGRNVFKKGGKAKDMSKKHEGMESKAEEAKEYAMEDKGYKETKSGKMVKGKSKMAKGGRPGLWANINARKKAGTSRSKSESTISPKAYANMKAGFPKKKK